MIGKSSEIKIGKKREANKRICDTLLKIYEKKYLLNPIVKKHNELHIPIVDFEKQSCRSRSVKSESIKLSSQVAELFKDNNKGKPTMSFNKHVKGIIPMEKQIPRSSAMGIRCGLSYTLNYNQIFPKIQIKVNYEKEIKDKKNKKRRRAPLITPLFSKAGGSCPKPQNY